MYDFPDDIVVGNSANILRANTVWDIAFCFYDFLGWVIVDDSLDQ